MPRILVLARARNGSTPFMELLDSHPEIELRGEPGELLHINDDDDQCPLATANCDNIYDYLNDQLTAAPETVVAFKVLADQLLRLNLRTDDVVRRCAIDSVVVVWRENVVEAAVSQLLATSTGKWHSLEHPGKVERITVDPVELAKLLDEAENSWTKAFQNWPIEMKPIFARYEELFTSDCTWQSINAKMAPIFRQLGVQEYNWARCYGKRQNPAPLKDKVDNWWELPIELRNRKIDVPAIFKKVFDEEFREQIGELAVDQSDKSVVIAKKGDDWKCCFVDNNDWRNYSSRAFAQAIDTLMAKHEADNGEILFIPAVELYMSDADEVPSKPWVGIVHNIREYPEQFYVPDLHRLCTKKRYRPWLKLCRGLFTLTIDQADYLEQNLRPAYDFPIVPIKYPLTALSAVSSHFKTAETRWVESGVLDVYFIGDFNLDVDRFFNAKLPATARKILLNNERQECISIPEDVLLVARVEEEEYERILNESIVFLSLKQGAAANTTVLECIARNTPIIAPRLSSVEEYLGKDYPLFYEKDMLDFTQFLTLEKLNEASAYLRAMDKSKLSIDYFVTSIEQSAIVAEIDVYNSGEKAMGLTIGQDASIDHIQNGFSKSAALVDDQLKEKKKRTWQLHTVGININSEITMEEIDLLKSIGVRLVRIGVVGAGRDQAFEFSELNGDQQQKNEQIVEIVSLIQALHSREMNVVITLERRVASADNWLLLAEHICRLENIVGYDLINEPFTAENSDQHWYEIETGDYPHDNSVLLKIFQPLINAIRSRDQVTPIIIESPFWAHISALNHLPIDELKRIDDNIIASVHFFEPQLLTYRQKNKGRFGFPGSVPIYDSVAGGDTINVSEEFINQRFELIAKWTEKTGVPVFIGEVGICREIHGAVQYLATVAAACRRLSLPMCFYAFRDPDWEAMDYELGADVRNEHKRDNSANNNLFNGLVKAFRG